MSYIARHKSRRAADDVRRLRAPRSQAHRPPERRGLRRPPILALRLSAVGVLMVMGAVLGSSFAPAPAMAATGATTGAAIVAAAPSASATEAPAGPGPSTEPTQKPSTPSTSNAPTPGPTSKPPSPEPTETESPPSDPQPSQSASNPEPAPSTSSEPHRNPTKAASPAPIHYSVTRAQVQQRLSNLESCVIPFWSYLEVTGTPEQARSAFAYQIDHLEGRNLDELNEGAKKAFRFASAHVRPYLQQSLVRDALLGLNATSLDGESPVTQAELINLWRTRGCSTILSERYQITENSQTRNVSAAELTLMALKYEAPAPAVEEDPTPSPTPTSSDTPIVAASIGSSDMDKFLDHLAAYPRSTGIGGGLIAVGLALLISIPVRNRRYFST